MQCDNFDIDFKNLIGYALDACQNTEPALCFAVPTDTNAAHFQGQHNWAFGLPKQDTVMVVLSIHAQFTRVKS